VFTWITFAVILHLLRYVRLYTDHIGLFEETLEITVMEFVRIFLGLKNNSVITAVWFVVDDIAQPYLNRDSTGKCFAPVPGTPFFLRQ
jgi:hypothetical protein